MIPNGHPADPSAAQHGSPASPPLPTWANLPNKDQVAILALSRFVDFFQLAALQTYMYYQLKSFDPDLSEYALSSQTGILQAAFNFAQIGSSFLWGLAADQPSVGRKMVLQIGLVGTAVGCVGVAFSRSFHEAVFWRLMSGALNATVGSARSIVAECTPKPWHSRAFLLLPAAFNLANIAGPVLSGLLVEPVQKHSRLFGPGSGLGGEDGVAWMTAYPYAPPNLLCAFLLLAEALLVHFYLRETLRGKRPFRIAVLDPTNVLRAAWSYLQGARRRGYRPILTHQDPTAMEMTSTSDNTTKAPPRLPLRRMWTANVLWTLVSIAIFDFHMGAFSNLWILLLSTTRDFVPPANNDMVDGGTRRPLSFFKFSSGLAFTPSRVGAALAIIGGLGVVLQFLLYPPAERRFGLMRCFRASLFLFPIAYYLAPFIAQLPSTTPSPSPADGWPIWAGISLVLLLQVSARTFALPAIILLLNNASPHPSVLGAVNGLGQACSALFRTLGPWASSIWFNTWRQRGVVGVSWWIVASIAALGCVASFWVRDGSAHQIVLPGEEAEVKEGVAGGGSGDGR